MRLRTRSIVLFVVLLTSWNLYAITDEELFRNFQFSFVNPGARSTAMGGAFIGLADDATAAEANPAGLTALTKPEVSVEYRNVSFDQAELNSFNNVVSPGQTTTITTVNLLEDTNRVSFASVVYPVGKTAFAFSRQEAVRLKGSLDELFVIGDGTIQPKAIGTEELNVVNYNFSAAVRLQNLSLGATLRVSTLDWKAGVANRIDIVFPPDPPVLISTFDTSLDETDSAFAFNLGAIYKAGKSVSLGAVYKRNAEFQVTETVSGDLAPKGPFTNVLKIPDTFGFGIAVLPRSNLTITADVVRVKYSDLTRDFLAGFGIVTACCTNEDVTYDISDATEFHLGGELFVFTKNVTIAFRGGYYRDPSNSLVATSTPGLNADTAPVVNALFHEGEDENHFSFGNGFLFGTHLQVDWAVDLAPSANNAVISTVVKF